MSVLSFKEEWPSIDPRSVDFKSLHSNLFNLLKEFPDTQT